ncbi:ABC transporter permease [Oscillospiraceae bacterium Marseille-Q3528]|nr:ABC transporter permease [Oscillospiraceae bacterium Marseille-Q3528]WNV59238.1 ABC transporter permease [Oscillospiraceae bacterium NTUH-002-81]
MTLFIGILEQGFIYGIMALGAYITYKILDFPDLTVDGSFPLGAAVTVALISRGVNPYLTFPIAALCGALAGMCTGLIHVKGKVRDLLSGIIMMTALYTINYRIAGKSNVPMFSMKTAFDNDFINSLPAGLTPVRSLLVILIVSLACKFLLDAYLCTRSGFLLRAVGDNDMLVTSLAKNNGTVKIIGLAIANGLVALGGSVMCQQQRFFDLSMGTGTVVICLASVIIGTSVFKNVTFLKPTTAVLLGSIFYKACVAIAMNVGFQATDMKLIMAVLFLVILIVNRDRKRKVKGHA